MSSQTPNECPICLEVLKGSGKALFTTACGHEFHFDCIRSSIHMAPNEMCPICRRNIPQLADIPPPAAAVSALAPAPAPTPTPTPTPAPAPTPLMNPFPQQQYAMNANVNVFPHPGNMMNANVNVFPQQQFHPGNMRNANAFPRYQQMQSPFSSYSSSSSSPDEDLDEQLPGPNAQEQPASAPASASSSSSSSPSSNASELKISTEVEVSQVPPSFSRSLYAMASIQAPFLPGDMEADRAPLDIVAVVDKSGSMGGEKMELVKQALCYLLTQLTKKDRLSVVSFDSSSYGVFGLRWCGTGDESLENLVNSHSQMRAGGGTSIRNGLSKGISVLRNRKHLNPITAIMLLTDGQGGDPSDDELTNMMMGLENVPIHCFGFGRDHDARVLTRIAEKGHGNFSFVENVSTIGESFATCLGGMLSVAAQDLQLNVHIDHPEVKLEKIISTYAHTIHPSHKDAHVRIPDMLAEEKKDLIFSLALPPHLPLGVHPLFSISLTYLDPNSKDKGERLSVVPVSSTLTVAEGDLPAGGVNLRLDKEKNRVLVAEAMRNAVSLGESGKLEDARKVLSEALSKIMQSATAQDEYVKFLKKDLEDCLSRFQDRATYSSSGYAYAQQQQKMHHEKRAVNAVSPGYSNSIQLTQQTKSSSYSKKY